MPTAQRSGTDASLVLARQLIAAKLNLANGSDPTTIGTTVAEADRLLAVSGGKLPYGVRRSSVSGQSMVSDAELLRSYNTGGQTPNCVRDRDPEDATLALSRKHRRPGHRSHHRVASLGDGSRVAR